jgi:hypothetical protein
LTVERKREGKMLTRIGDAVVTVSEHFRPRLLREERRQICGVLAVVSGIAENDFAVEKKVANLAEEKEVLSSRYSGRNRGRMHERECRQPKCRSRYSVLVQTVRARSEE